MDMKREYERLREMTEQQLDKYFAETVPQKQLYDAMRYSLLAGGKRIRPVIVLSFAQVSGGSAEAALPLACAVEMVHTYSLIHDDLPCMDNDVLRRGKPTNHIVFGECTATLAGDALCAAAFETLLGAQLEAERLLEAARELSFAAGENGICGGQILDMEGEASIFSVSEIATVHEMKTASLIKAAARIGVIAGGGTKKQIEAATRYAEGVGLAFQMRDDILNQVSTVEKLGKSVGSDESSGKSTFVSLLGIEECEKIIANETAKAKSAVSEAFDKPEFFLWLADTLADRKY